LEVLPDGFERVAHLVFDGFGTNIECGGSLFVREPAHKAQFEDHSSTFWKRGYRLIDSIAQQDKGERIVGCGLVIRAHLDGCITAPGPIAEVIRSPIPTGSIEIGAHRPRGVKARATVPQTNKYVLQYVFGDLGRHTEPNKKAVKRNVVPFKEGAKG
jgi:hypothetical protein